MNLLLVRFIDFYIGIVLAFIIFIIKKVVGRKRGFKNLKKYDKILIIKFWGIGNTALLLPSIRGLRKTYPCARIDYLTELTNRGIARMSHAFDNIYHVNVASFATFVRDTLKNIIKLRRENYDLVIDYEQFARFSAIFTALICKKTTVGFETRNQHRHFLYTLPVRYNNEIHMVDSFCSCVEQAGVHFKKTLDSDFLFCGSKDTQRAIDLLSSTMDASHDISILMHLGTSANFTLRRWPINYFAELADKLIENFPVVVLLTASPEEKELANQTLQYIKNKSYTINLGGALNFEEFAALIKQSDLVLSCDTSTVHIASCFSVPTIGLYGPNTPRLYGPWGKSSISLYKNLDCSPCITNYNAKINSCRHPEGKGICMRKIIPGEVFNSIKKNFFNGEAPFRLKKMDKYAKDRSIS